MNSKWLSKSVAGGAALGLIVAAQVGYAQGIEENMSIEERRALEQERQAIDEAKAEYAVPEWLDRFETATLIEFEGSYNDTQDGSESDFELATFEFGLDIAITDNVSGYGVILIESPDHDVEFDQGGIILDWDSLNLNLGKQYVPFGEFETFMISDPLTLEIGETNQESATLEYGNDTAGFSVFAFNGDVDKVGKNNQVDNFGTRLRFTPNDDFAFGVSYMNSLSQADGFEDAFVDGVNDYTGAFGVNALANFGPVTVIGEYIAADDDLNSEQSSKISAYNVEIGYGFELAGKDSVFALGYQGTNDAAFVDLPEKRTIVTLSSEIYDATTLSFQYANDDNYSSDEGGSGGSSDGFILQLAIEI